MANILKQSTQIKVRLGPFVDATDGVTPETGITLGTADQAEALKADGAATVDISGATWAAVTGADGWYDLTLTTSHTDTIGELVIVVQDSSVSLPVFARFQVVEEAIYDALFAASAAGFDANQRVDVGAWLGQAVTLSSNNKPDVNVDEWADVALATTNPLPNAAPDAAGGLLITVAGTLDMDGLNTTVTAIAADLPVTITKNTALSNFMFLMVDLSDDPATGLTVTAQRSLDGAAFGACANSVTELSNGIYVIDLAAGDTNGDTVMYRFSATGAKDRFIFVVTKPT